MEEQEKDVLFLMASCSIGSCASKWTGSFPTVDYCTATDNSSFHPNDPDLLLQYKEKFIHFSENAREMGHDQSY